MSYPTTGGPGKERRTNKLPPSGRIQERSKEERSCQNICPTNLPESFSLESILVEQWVCHQEEARGNLETNSITIKPETASHMVEQFSWVPLPCCSPLGSPFPIKSLALSACVSSQIIHFRVLDKSPLSGPGRGPLSCNNFSKNIRPRHMLSIKNPLEKPNIKAKID